MGNSIVFFIVCFIVSSGILLCLTFFITKLKQSSSRNYSSEDLEILRQCVSDEEAKVKTAIAKTQKMLVTKISFWEIIRTACYFSLVCVFLNVYGALPFAPGVKLFFLFGGILPVLINAVMLAWEFLWPSANPEAYISNREEWQTYQYTQAFVQKERQKLNNDERKDEEKIVYTWKEFKKSPIII